MDIEIDDSTGLPKLPEGFYWSVTQPTEDKNEVWVRLLPAEEHNWDVNAIQSIREPDHNLKKMVCKRPSKVTKEDILEAAKQITKDMWSFLCPEPIETCEFVGDYPPQNINNVERNA